MANKLTSASNIEAPVTTNMAKSDVATQLALLDSMKASIASPVFTGNISTSKSTNADISCNVINTAGHVALGHDSGAGYIGTFSNTPLEFYTNSTEKVRLTTDGKLGIGVTSPQATLHSTGSTILGCLGSDPGWSSLLSINRISINVNEVNNLLTFTYKRTDGTIKNFFVGAS